MLEKQLHAARIVRGLRSRSAAKQGEHGYFGDHSGESESVSPMDIPAASYSNVSETVIPMPRVHGLPLGLPRPIVIRKLLDVNNIVGMVDRGSRLTSGRHHHWCITLGCKRRRPALQNRSGPRGGHSGAKKLDGAPIIEARCLAGYWHRLCSRHVHSLAGVDVWPQEAASRAARYQARLLQHEVRRG